MSQRFGKFINDTNRLRHLAGALFLLVAGMISIAVILFAPGRNPFSPIVTDKATDAASEVTGDAPTETPTQTPTEPEESTVAPEVPSDPAEGSTAVPPETEAPEEPADPVSGKTLAELIAEGYRIDWGEYAADRYVIARYSAGTLADAGFSLGTTKNVTVRVPVTYEDGGIQFAETETRTEQRRAAEVYMGYILIDLGYDLAGVPILEIRNSYNEPIGVFPSSQIVPAYTRDSLDRPLFRQGDALFYLDEKEGKLVPSDYIDEIDGRGLYFDYNPDYGKSDSSLHIYHTEQTIKMTYDMDMSSYLTRYGVDYRIARQFYEKYPTYAELVSLPISATSFYNYVFHIFLEKAKAEIEQEKQAGIYAPLPQEFPWEIPAEPETTGAETEVPTEAPTEAPTETPEESPAEAPTEAETETPTEAETEVPTETPTEAETEEPQNPAEPKKNHAYVSSIFTAYRFIYAKSDPGVNPDTTTTLTLQYTPYITQTMTWAGQYRHARAYNFSEGRAVTVTDNGLIRVINTGGGTAIYLYHIFKADDTMGNAYMTEFYIEPFERDVTMLGYYYFDNGLMRLRKCNRLSHVINKYNEDMDILVDISGKQYRIPEGFTLVSYSEGVLLLERQGRYGYYHKDGYWIAQPVYTYAMPFVEGVGVLGRADGMRGAIDKSGNVVIPFEYTDVSNASSGIFACFHPERGWEILAKMTKSAN